MLGKIPYYLGNFVFTKCFTPKKFLNLAIASVDWVLKKETLRSHPYYAMIDPCNVCVLHCPLCPTGKGELGRTKAMMSLGEFTTIFDQMKDYLYEVYLYIWGEPLMNKDIFRMIRYAHESRVRTRISSNLNYFREGFARQIVTSGLDTLLVALDGASQQTYEQYRRGGDFELAVGNVREIAAEKRRQNSTTPRLIWQFLAMRHNEKEIPKARAMARDLGFDHLKITPLRSDASTDIFQSDEEKIASSWEWLPEDQGLSWFDYETRKKVTRNKSCKFPWSMPAVNPDGSLSPCCGVYPEKYDFGNVLHQGFAAVWNGPQYVASRSLIAGRRSAISTVCANCLKNGFF